jgi:hypothetical protein
MGFSTVMDDRNKLEEGRRPMRTLVVSGSYQNYQKLGNSEAKRNGYILKLGNIKAKRAYLFQNITLAKQSGLGFTKTRQ